jgi:hypothetical protein
MLSTAEEKMFMIFVKIFAKMEHIGRFLLNYSQCKKEFPKNSRKLLYKEDFHEFFCNNQKSAGFSQIFAKTKCHKILCILTKFHISAKILKKHFCFNPKYRFF